MTPVPVAIFAPLLHTAGLTELFKLLGHARDSSPLGLTRTCWLGPTDFCFAANENDTSLARGVEASGGLPATLGGRNQDSLEALRIRSAYSISTGAKGHDSLMYSWSQNALKKHGLGSLLHAAAIASHATYQSTYKAWFHTLVVKPQCTTKAWFDKVVNGGKLEMPHPGTETPSRDPVSAVAVSDSTWIMALLAAQDKAAAAIGFERKVSDSRCTAPSVATVKRVALTWWFWSLEDAQDLHSEQQKRKAANKAVHSVHPPQ
jgi:hypothetical protein